MTISLSHGSYLDCFEVFERALEDKNGVRVKMPGIDAANFFRMRMNTARSLARKKNKQVYDPGHHMHGASEYDRLVVRIKEASSGVYVYVEPNEIDASLIESLSEVTEEVISITAPKNPIMIEIRPNAPLMIEGFKRRM